MPGKVPAHPPGTRSRCPDPAPSWPYDHQAAAFLLRPRPLRPLPGPRVVDVALALGALAIVRSALATGLALWLLGLDVTGSAWLVLLDALLGTALGLFVAAFAASELQAVQFIPAVIFPQLLLCRLRTPRSRMHPALEAVSDVLPTSYAVDGMNEVLRHADMTATFVRDLPIVAGRALLLALRAATLRRRTVCAPTAGPRRASVHRTTTSAPFAPVRD